MKQDEYAEIQAMADEMSRHLADVVNGVQEDKEVRAEAFERADRLATQLAKLLKGRELLPRQMLLNLDMAAGVLENEAAYAKDPVRVDAMSRTIRMTFGLILRGESHDDRGPDRLPA